MSTTTRFDEYAAALNRAPSAPESLKGPLAFREPSALWSPAADAANNARFDVQNYLATAGPGRAIVPLLKGQRFFSQGDLADSVFYLQRGRLKIAFMSPARKQATVRLVSAGEFFGESAMQAESCVRFTTATAVLDCTALKIQRAEFLRVMQEEPAFAYRFSSSLLSCNMRQQADLVDQILNRAEKRLARLLLLLAESGEPCEDESPFIPAISQESMATMIGSTRSRVNGFMNRFRKLGLIDYDTDIRVHRPMMRRYLRD